MIDHRTAPYAALVLRLSLAFFFLAHLLPKVCCHGLRQLVERHAEGRLCRLGECLYAGREFAGAILLLLGVYTRYVSVLVLPVLIAITYHHAIRKGFWFSDGGAEFALAWTFMLCVQVLLGDGAYALRVPGMPWNRGSRALAAAPH
jgi:putative oxidoreductase